MHNASHWLRHTDGTYKQVDENFAHTHPSHPFFKVTERPHNWTPPEGLHSQVSNKDFMGNLFRRESIRRTESTVQSPALTSELTINEQGLITKKQEHFAGGLTDSWEYSYDKQDRLKRVRLNGEVFESYKYNAYGARVADNVWSRDDRTFEYTDGKVSKAGGNSYEYAGDGSLVKRASALGTTYFDYGRDNGLNRIVLPGPCVVDYHTGEHGLPLLKSFNNQLLERIQWLDMFRVDSWMDAAANVGIRFHYGEDRLPHSMTVFDDGMHSAHGTTYLLGWDQCGTIKAVCDQYGNLVKKVLYDSFGNVLHDSNPAFVLPLGFAGGLKDEHTGFVRFGYRDYDPEVGRFTDRDPLGDTGGDHDLYEYCVDDPVNKVDPTGLWLVPVAGAAVGGAINAYNNLDAYRNNEISGWQYAGTILTGAAAGAIGGGWTAGVKGVAAKTLPKVAGALFKTKNAIQAGAVSGAVNEIGQQQIMHGEVKDGKAVLDSMLTGGGIGFVGASATRMGKPIQQLANKRGISLDAPLEKVEELAGGIAEWGSSLISNASKNEK